MLLYVESPATACPVALGSLGYLIRRGALLLLPFAQSVNRLSPTNPPPITQPYYHGSHPIHCCVNREITVILVACWRWRAGLFEVVYDFYAVRVVCLLQPLREL